MSPSTRPLLRLVKIGGQVLDDPPLLHTALAAIAHYAGPMVLVHGGGKRATQLSQQLGLAPQLVDGRRITDAATLEVVTMVYAGLLNKNLVAQLQAHGRNAIGLSGADANLLRARQRPATPINYGFVGDIEAVDPDGILPRLLEAGLTPVCCPLTHDGQGQLLNTNADTIAAALATALSGSYQVQLYYCFEKPGVLTDALDNHTVIPLLTPERYAAYRAQGVISGGMIPKLDNAFAALQAGVHEVVIGHVSGWATGGGTAIRLEA